MHGLPASSFLYRKAILELRSGGGRPALTLLAVVTAFLTWGHVQTAITASQPGSGLDPNQSLWDLALPVGMAAWIGAVLVWPRKKG